jgi:hypothetical protein
MRLAALIGLALVAPARADDTAAYRYILTSAATNRNTATFELTHRDLPEVGTAAWSIRKTTLHGGKQEGVELITLDNGTLVLRLIPTRGLSVLDVRQGGLRVGWDSPVKEVVHPAFINLESRGGLGWLEGFNEWLVRCGLEYAGHPGRDEFIDNTGSKTSMNLTLHGRVGNLPASEVEVLIDRQAPHRLRVRGVVHERQFHGPKLRLTAEISTTPGSDTFRIEDTVTNLGDAVQEMQLIYHANYGAPLLEAGATVRVAVRRMAPMNPHAAAGIDTWQTYAGPTKGFVEQVYLVHPYADDQGRATVLLSDRRGEKGASITWSIQDLPYLTVWKNTAAIEDGYVTGLEPGTGFPFNRRIERQFGRVPKLAPHESRRITLDFGLHASRQAVAAVADRIHALQNGRAPQVDKEPPKTEPPGK